MQNLNINTLSTTNLNSDQYKKKEDNLKRQGENNIFVISPYGIHS